jgi:hypothetical protein
MKNEINELAHRMFKTIQESNNLYSIYPEILNDFMNTFIQKRLDNILDNSNITYELKDVKNSIDAISKELSNPILSEFNFSKMVSFIFNLENLLDLPKKEIVTKFRKLDYKLKVKEIENYFSKKSTVILQESTLRKYCKLFSYYLELNKEKIRSGNIDNDNPIQRQINIEAKLFKTKIVSSMEDIILKNELRFIQGLLPGIDPYRFIFKRKDIIEDLYYRVSPRSYNSFIDEIYKENNIWGLSFLFKHDSNTLEKKIAFMKMMESTDINFQKIMQEEYKEWKNDNHIERIVGLEYNLNEFYKKWINRKFLNEWDNYWDKMEKCRLHEGINALRNEKEEIIDLNIDLQLTNKKLETKLIGKKKYKTLTKFSVSQNHNWSNIRILFAVDHKVIAYELQSNGKNRLKITERLRKILIKICLAPEDREIKYNKQERYEVNKFFKERFNINEDAISWDRNHKVYKIHFHYKFLQYMPNFKMINASSMDGFEFTDNSDNEYINKSKITKEYDHDLAGYEDFYPKD